MKKILLIDVDSKIPNLALIKLSAYHKLQGNEINVIKLGYTGYPSKNPKPTNINISSYQEVYVSTIFTHNKNMIEFTGDQSNTKIFFGGSGNDLYAKLPKDVESCSIDLEEYDDGYSGNTLYYFITRGCIRKCKWCFVPKMEGDLYLEGNVSEALKLRDQLNYKYIEFLDNNILAHPDHILILSELVNKKVKCRFSQGLDIRLLNEENATILNQIQYHKEYTFAFDFVTIENIIQQKLNMIERLNLSMRNNMKFFVFVSPHFSSIEQDIYRVEWLRERGILPYIMRENRCWDVEDERIYNFYIDLASWCNIVSAFKKMSFYQFLEQRHGRGKTRNSTRIQSSSYIFSQYANNVVWNKYNITNKKNVA